MRLGCCAVNWLSAVPKVTKLVSYLCSKYTGIIISTFWCKIVILCTGYTESAKQLAQDWTETKLHQTYNPGVDNISIRDLKHIYSIHLSVLWYSDYGVFNVKDIDTRICVDTAGFSLFYATSRSPARILQWWYLVPVKLCTGLDNNLPSRSLTFSTLSIGTNLYLQWIHCWNKNIV